MNDVPRRPAEPVASSRLPQADAYWDELADRISAEARPIVERFGERPTSSFLGWVETRSLFLAAGALAAAVAAWLLLPPAEGAVSDGATSVGATAVAEALAPEDPTAAGFGTAPLPPTIGSLVLRIDPAEVQP